MRCPTLAELPSPPAGKTGWPWTEESPRCENVGQVANLPYVPRVSIVTPSYNQARFLEETIRSVLLQGYPDLEYMIFDGGSTDGSAEIIRKYEPWLAYWASERDAGQSDAINKGFQRATGEIVAWLNSDDTYEPGTVAAAARALSAAPGAALVYGDCHLIDDRSRRTDTWRTVQADLEMLVLEGNKIPQQSAFMRRAALSQAGWVDPTLHYVMDYELWLRLALTGPLIRTEKLAANFRFQPDSKTMTRVVAFWDEHLAVFQRLRAAELGLSPATLEEAIRRVHVRAALEGLFIDDYDLALAHLEEALAAGVCPYGTPHVLAQRMVERTGLTRRSLGDSVALTSASLGILSRLQDRRRARQIRNAVRGFDAIRQAFSGHAQGDRRRVRRHIWKGLLLDPAWLANPGVRSILVQAYLPGGLTRKGDADR